MNVCERIRWEIVKDWEGVACSVQVKGEAVRDGVAGGVIVSVTDGRRLRVSLTVLVTVIKLDSEWVFVSVGDIPARRSEVLLAVKLIVGE